MSIEQAILVVCSSPSYIAKKESFHQVRLGKGDAFFYTSFARIFFPFLFQCEITEPTRVQCSPQIKLMRALFFSRDMLLVCVRCSQSIRRTCHMWVDCDTFWSFQRGSTASAVLPLSLLLPFSPPLPLPLPLLVVVDAVNVLISFRHRLVTQGM